MVMFYGVLFWGGDEQKICKSLIEKDQIEVIIGLLLNLFYGIGILVCILVMCWVGEKLLECWGKVLFINVDVEFYVGWVQNYLKLEYIEKIVNVFEVFVDILGYVVVVSWEILVVEENDFNCNIWCYVDNVLLLELQDVMVYLLGGIFFDEIEV